MNTKSIEKNIKKEFRILIMLSVAFWGYYTLLVLLDLALFIGIPLCVPRIGALILPFAGCRIFTVPINYILSLFRNYRYEPIAPKEISEKDAPQLFSMIREIAAKTGNIMPKRVYLTSEFGAHVNYNYNFQLGFVSNIEYELTIGIRLLREMNVSELKSILAHEFGHFSKRSAMTVAHVNWLDTTYERMQHTPKYNNILWKFLPLFYYPLTFILARPLTAVFYKHISVRTQWLKRCEELYSDSVACEITGSKPFVSSLCKLEMPTNSFDLYSQMLAVLLREGYSVREFFKGYSFVDEQTAEDVSMNVSFRDTLTGPVGDAAIYPSRIPVLLAWDVHPSLQERIVHVNSLPFGEGEVYREVASSLVKEEALSDWGKTFQYYLKIDQGKPKDWKPQVMEHEEFVAWATNYLAEHRTPHFLLPFMEKHIEKFKMPDDRTIEMEVVENPFTEANRNLILEHATAYADMEKLKMIKSGLLCVLEFTYCDVTYTDPAYPMSVQERYLSTLQRRWEDLDVKVYKYLWKKTNDTLHLKNLYWMMSYAEDSYSQITNMPLKAGKGGPVYLYKFDEWTGNVKMVFSSWKMRRTLKKGIMKLLQSLEYDRMESLSKESWYSHGEAAPQILQKCRDIAMKRRRLRSDKDIILLAGELQGLFQNMHNNARDEWHRIMVAVAEGGQAQIQSRVQSGRVNKHTSETETGKATNKKSPNSIIPQTKDDFDEDTARTEDSCTMDTQVENPSTRVTDKDLSSATKDRYGVLYSYDGKRLLTCRKSKWNLFQRLMTHYTVKEGTEIICDNAFANMEDCKWLEHVTIPGSTKTIGEGAFGNRKEMKQLDMGDGVNKIGNKAFQGCSGLKELRLSDNVDVIGERAFDGCTGLGMVKLPDSLKSIGKYAFSACKGLKRVDIGRGVVSIGDYAFQNCNGLREVFFYATNCQFVGTSRNIIVPIFEGCTKLEKANINCGATIIPAHLFYNCASLKTVEIANGVSEIGTEAFLDCAGITHVVLPESVREIGGGAFDGCQKLAWIEVSEENSHFCSQDGILYSKDMKELVRFPGGSTATSFTIPQSVKFIRELAFSACGYLRKLVLPVGLKEIGDDCFLDSKKLRLQVACPAGINKTAVKAKFEDMLSGQGIDTISVTGEASDKKSRTSSSL